MNRHSFSSSRLNRDRREDAFARAVIGLAEARRRDEEARDALPEQEHCIYCSDPLPIDAPHYPYCTTRCGVDASLEGAD